MHLAAESHVDRSIDGPKAFIESNIVGTFNLLQSCLSHYRSSFDNKNFRFHHVSTDEVFGSLGNEAHSTKGLHMLLEVLIPQARRQVII